MVPRRRRLRRLRASSPGRCEPKYDGIEQADSFILDPHKWLFTPFDCCALLYREPELARATHTQDASYLDVIHAADGEWNPTDYAYHLTRRARGLPLWFSLAVNGVDAYREAIEVAVALARETADLIQATPHLELIREPDLGVVLFRRVGWKPEDYDALGAARCTTTRSRSSRRASGTARRSAGSRSCTPTPAWTWCARSWPGPSEHEPTCSRSSRQAAPSTTTACWSSAAAARTTWPREFGTPVLVVAEAALRARAREYVDELVGALGELPGGVRVEGVPVHRRAAGDGRGGPRTRRRRWRRDPDRAQGGRRPGAGRAARQREERRGDRAGGRARDRAGRGRQLRRRRPARGDGPGGPDARTCWCGSSPASPPTRTPTC